jgi:asparagine synthase (glutamine-hydrolysing)
MSDVPLGAFLSGGIDSSAVVAAMAEQTSEPVKTFSIGFNDRTFDETRYARQVAERFGTDHHEFTVEPEAAEIFPMLARHYGEPFADSSAIPSFYLADLTRRHVTVALNGDGGDENFAGYGRYLRGAKLERLEWLPEPVRRLAPPLASILGPNPPTGSFRGRAQRLAGALASNESQRYSMSLTAFTRQQRDRLLTSEFKAQLDGRRGETFVLSAWERSTATELVERMMDTDIETYLPGDLLPKIDIATMAHSLEARSPFLDHHLMEFAAALPAHLKLNGGERKLLLKRALRGRLPDEVLDRSKMGFGVPIGSWFRNELRELPRERLLDPRALDRGYFERREVERLIDDHQRGRADNSLQIWVLLQLEIWHSEVADQRLLAVRT